MIFLLRIETIPILKKADCTHEVINSLLKHFYIILLGYMQTMYSRNRTPSTFLHWTSCAIMS